MTEYKVVSHLGHHYTGDDLKLANMYADENNIDVWEYAADWDIILQ